MKKLFLLILASALVLPQVYASPFDVLYLNVPDFVVSNIGQDTNSEYIYVSVCNKGGLMTDTGDLVIGVKRNYKNGPNESIIVDDIRYKAGECNSYQVAKTSQLGITSNGTYPLAGGVRLANYKREESNTNNNILIKDVYINHNYVGYSDYGSTYPNYNTNPTYYNNIITYPSYTSYGSNLGDLTVNDINYYEKTTITDYGSSREVYNSIVASICNNGNAINNAGSIRIKVEVGGRTDYIYMNSNAYWNAGTCKKIWSSVDNFSITYNNSIGVGVTVDDSNVLTEQNEGNNYLYKSVYIPNYSNNNNNYSSNGYYCNGTWYSYSSNSNGYTCNGIWYNRNNDEGNYSQDSYYCNNTWYTYSYNATGYYCNGNWYSRTGGNYDNSYDYYYCNGTRYNYTANATGYSCNGSWYGRSGNSSASDYYYCNGARYNYNSDSNGYYCNGTWYYRNYVGNDYYNDDSSRGYYCNGNHYYSSYSDGYYCNGIWHSFYSDGSDRSYSNENDYGYDSDNYGNTTGLTIKNLFINNENRRIYAVICNNSAGTQAANTYAKVNFYSSTTGRSRSINAKIVAYAGGCTDINTFVTYEDLGINSRGNYNIRASLGSANSNSSNSSITNNIWIPY